MENKIFVVGDIHGMWSKFIKVVKQIKSELSPDDYVVFLGDYIDRGKCGYRILKYLYKWQNKNKNVICLLGNHEDMMLEYFRKKNIEDYKDIPEKGYGIWISGNGGETTVRDILNHIKKGEDVTPVLDWVMTLPCLYRKENFRFSHAGFNAYRGRYGLKQRKEDYLWTREDFFEYYVGKERWFVGHTPTQLLSRYMPFLIVADMGICSDTDAPVTFNNITVMDTGSFLKKTCTHGRGKISCIEIRSGRLFQS